MADQNTDDVFRFFTEVGIIAQLGATLLARHLPPRLSGVHFGLLSHLSRRPEGTTPLQLAFAFQVPKTSMTHMVKVLEAEGLITIAPNPQDARSKLARITPKGIGVVDATVSGVARDLRQMQPGFDVDLARDCLGPLARIRTQLDTARNSDRPE